MNYLATVFTAIIVLWHTSGLALGLGNPELHSQLGEKLQLQIPLLGMADMPDDAVKIGIANMETYKKLDVDFDASHNKLRFTINHQQADKLLLMVSSTQVISEPYLHFVLEIVYPQGTVLKDISVLLDAPSIQ